MHATDALSLPSGFSRCYGACPDAKAGRRRQSRRRRWTFRRALVEAQERLTRFVVGYVQRQEAFRSGKRLDRQALSRLLEEALAAYERAHGVAGVVAGYRRARAALGEARSGDRLTAWWDSLGLDAEQQVWMARLWEVFRTSSTVGELDERLGRYEEAVVEALGVERSGVMLWSSGVWYSFAVLVFGREEWVEAFWALVRGLMGVDGGGGGMARWGVLGGRGWFRLAQQHTTCELNSMPQIGDYRTLEGLLVHFVEFGGLGCGIGGIFGGPAGCYAGAVLGTLAGAAIYYFLTTSEAYQVDMNRWCRQNYTVCRNNEYYRAACSEIIEQQ